jgi:glycosyltransferase involved in cell wall biosynthesis
MRIGIDITAALADRTGVGCYAASLARALLRAGGDEVVACAHVFRHPGWRRKIARLLTGAPRPAAVRESRLLPHRAVLEANRHFDFPTVEGLFGPLDVYHGTNFLCPPAHRARTVATCHDLAFLRFPAEVRVAHVYERFLGPSLRRTDVVIVPSEAARRDVIEFAGVSPQRIAVVPEGGPESFPLLPAGEFRRLRARLGLPERYWLFLGTIEPRKNLPRLLAACRVAWRRLPDPPGLVLAGRRGWHARAVEHELSRPFEAAPVVRTGFVPEAVRNSLLAHAVALVLPSLWEGFGLPVLEAFAAGTPVLCSAAGALPEVAGDAALLFDPRDEGAIAAGLVEIASDPGLRADLARRGRSRLPLYTWARTAALTRRAYREE